MTAVTYPPFLTASRIDLFLACPASAILAQTQDTSAAAQRGTDVHAETLRPSAMPRVFLEWFALAGRPLLTDDDRSRAHPEPRYEAALGWDPASGAAAFLGENLDREYEFPTPDWLSGTADACQVRDGVLSVADLKTGYHQTRGALGDPAQSGQLRLLAWMLWQHLAHRKARAARDFRGLECWPVRGAPRQCATHGRPLASCAAERDAEVTPWAPARIRVAWFLRPEGGEPTVEEAELGPAELRAWAGRLAVRAERARASAPVVRPGPQCGTCPCFDACPAHGQALRRLSELPGDGPVTDEDAVLAYYALIAAERTATRGKAALRTYVERRADEARARGDAQVDVPVGGGRALRLVRSTRRRIDPRVALESGVIPPEAVELSVSQESIRRAAGGRVDVDDVMDRLDAAGAVTEVQVAPHVQLVRTRNSG